MRNLTKNMTIAAAALMVAAGVAGAQTIQAEVPFGFRAAGTVMPAGSYRVSKNQLGARIKDNLFQIWNELETWTRT